MNRHFAAARYLTWLHTVKCLSKKASHRDSGLSSRNATRNPPNKEVSRGQRDQQARACRPPSLASIQMDLLLIKIVRYLSVRSLCLEGYSSLTSCGFFRIETIPPSLFMRASGRAPSDSTKGESELGNNRKTRVKCGKTLDPSDPNPNGPGSGKNIPNGVRPYMWGIKSKSKFKSPRQ